MAIYRKKKFTSPEKVGGPEIGEIGAAHKSQKVGPAQQAPPPVAVNKHLHTGGDDVGLRAMDSICVSVPGTSSSNLPVQRHHALPTSHRQPTNLSV